MCERLEAKAQTGGVGPSLRREARFRIVERRVEVAAEAFAEPVMNFAAIGPLAFVAATERVGVGNARRDRHAAKENFRSDGTAPEPISVVNAQALDVAARPLIAKRATD